MDEKKNTETFIKQKKKNITEPKTYKHNIRIMNIT